MSTYSPIDQLDYDDDEEAEEANASFITESVRSKSTGSWINQENIREVQRFNDFRTIDWVEDELDAQRQRLLKVKQITSRGNNIMDKIISQTQNWVVLGIMGCIIGLIAGSLNIITSFLSNIRTGHCKKHIYLSEAFCCWGEEEGNHCQNWVEWTPFIFFNYIIYILISLLFAYLAAKLVKFYAPSAAGSGISEIKCIISGFVMDGFLGWPTLFIKSLGLPLAIGAGLSVGKEGPSVHYAVCVGNSIAKLITKYKKSALRGREFLTATSAAGVAVAFGSPMGGVLFSIEEMSSVFQLNTIWKSYFCALIAVTTLAMINPFRTGQLVLFEVTYDTNWHYFEIPIYIFLGIFGGIYGIIVSKLNIRVVAFRKKYLTNFAIREVLFLTLFTTSFSYFNQFLRLDMTETMQILFHECDKNFNHDICNPNNKKIGLIVSLLFATFARMLLTIITYGCKVPAGIFVPSMAAGATFGRALGILIDLFYQSHKESILFQNCPKEGKCIIPGTYAFLGAAAGLCGITDLTVTVVVIMFELTGAIRYIIPTMIVVAITKSINDKWGKGGIADQMINFNGLPLIETKAVFSFGTTVESAMSNIIVSFSSDINDAITLKQLRTTLNKTNYRGFPIIRSGSNSKVYGYITRYDVEFILKNQENVNEDILCNFNDHESGGVDKVDFSNAVNKSPLTINIETSLEYVLDVFVKLGARYILVEKDGFLVGIITRKDVLRYEHSIQEHKLDDTKQAKYDAFDAKVWEFMNLISISMKKNLGKIFHNDATRYL